MRTHLLQDIISREAALSNRGCPYAEYGGRLILWHVSGTMPKPRRGHVLATTPGSDAFGFLGYDHESLSLMVVGCALERTVGCNVSEPGTSQEALQLSR